MCGAKLRTFGAWISITSNHFMSPLFSRDDFGLRAMHMHRGQMEDIGASVGSSSRKRLGGVSGRDLSSAGIESLRGDLPVRRHGVEAPDADSDHTD